MKKSLRTKKTDCIRIFRPTWNRIVGKTGGRYLWYFRDSGGQVVRCRSGYEALFGSYLTVNGIPFEYENLSLVITGKVLYTPDFFLTMQGEFVELKGWSGTDLTQQRSIAMLRRKGFMIHVLGWAELRVLIGSPCKDYKTLMSRAMAVGQTAEDYFASTAWHPTIDEDESRVIQKSIFHSSLRKPIKIDKEFIRWLRR